MRKADGILFTENAAPDTATMDATAERASHLRAILRSDGALPAHFVPWVFVFVPPPSASAPPELDRLVENSRVADVDQPPEAWFEDLDELARARGMPAAGKIAGLSKEYRFVFNHDESYMDAFRELLRRILIVDRYLGAPPSEL